MRSLQGLYPLVDWILRLALTLVVFFSYHNTVWNLQFDRPEFYLAALAFTGGILLILGGLIRNNTITLVSGLLILGPEIVAMVHTFRGIDLGFGNRLLHIGVALYFIISGNRLK